MICSIPDNGAWSGTEQMLANRSNTVGKFVAVLIPVSDWPAARLAFATIRSTAEKRGPILTDTV